MGASADGRGDLDEVAGLVGALAGSEDGREGEATTAPFLASLLDGRPLSPKHRLIAQYLERKPRAAAFDSAADVAAAVGVNPATVVRFAQTLGFSGWPTLQGGLRHQYFSSLMPADVMSARAQDPSASRFEGAIRSDLRNLHTVLETTDRAAVEAVARLIARSRRTVLVSSGSYAAMGHVLSQLGQVMGYPITLETHSGPELLATLNLLDERDCVIGISFWRVAHQVTLALRSSQRRGIPTVGISDSIVSPVMKGVQHKLVVPTDSVSFFQSVSASVSVAYGILATLQDLDPDRVEKSICTIEELYADLEILET